LFVCLFVCTVEDISTYAGWCDRREILAQGRANVIDGNEVVWGLVARGGRKKEANEIFVTMGVNAEFCILANISATRARIHTKY